MARIKPLDSALSGFMFGLIVAGSICLACSGGRRQSDTVPPEASAVILAHRLALLEPHLPPVAKTVPPPTRDQYRAIQLGMTEDECERAMGRPVPVSYTGDLLGDRLTTRRLVHGEPFITVTLSFNNGRLVEKDQYGLFR